MGRKKVRVFGRIDNTRAKKRVDEAVETTAVPQEVFSDVQIEQKANISKRPQRKIPPSRVGREGDRQHEKVVGNMVPRPSRRTPNRRKCDIDENPKKTAPLPPEPKPLIVESKGKVEVYWKRSFSKGKRKSPG